MPIYNKEFGCWMSDPFPDASPEYDTDSEEIDYPSDTESDDDSDYGESQEWRNMIAEEEIIDIINGIVRQDLAAKKIQRAWRTHSIWVHYLSYIIKLYTINPACLFFILYLHL